MSIHDRIQKDLARRQETAALGLDDNLRYKKEVAEGLDEVFKGHGKIMGAARNPEQEKMSKMIIAKSAPDLALSKDEIRAEGVGDVSNGLEKIMVKSVETPDDEAKSLATVSQIGRNVSIIADEAKALREAGGAAMGTGN